MLSMKVEVSGCPRDGQWYKVHSWKRSFLTLGAEMHAGAEVHPHPAPEECKVMGERSRAGCWVLHPWGKALNPSSFAFAKGWCAAGGLVVSCRCQSIALLVRLQLGSRIPLPDAKLCVVGTQPPSTAGAPAWLLQCLKAQETVRVDVKAGGFGKIKMLQQWFLSFLS